MVLEGKDCDGPFIRHFLEPHQFFCNLTKTPCMPSTQTSVPDAVDGSHPAVSRMTACGYKATRCGVPSHVRLRLRKRTSEPITAAHNYLFGGNVSFAIRKQTFASVNLNGRCGSTPALRGCHTIERFCDAGEGQPSARIGHSLRPHSMSACGSERWYIAAAVPPDIRMSAAPSRMIVKSGSPWPRRSRKER